MAEVKDQEHLAQTESVQETPPEAGAGKQSRTPAQAWKAIPRKKRKKWTRLIAAVIVLMRLLGSFQSPATPAQNPGQQTTDAPQIGEPPAETDDAAPENLPAQSVGQLTLYYAEGFNMREIGELLGVNKSTVSRTIKRGERRLQRCLRYGAEAYLRGLG